MNHARDAAPLLGKKKFLHIRPIFVRIASIESVFPLPTLHFPSCLSDFPGLQFYKFSLSYLYDEAVCDMNSIVDIVDFFSIYPDAAVLNHFSGLTF